MGLERCASGHLYSTVKHGSKCPYCDATLERIEKRAERGFLGVNSRTYLDKPDQRGYVTGWLVCVKGPALGTSYRILPGKNFIGRTGYMDICIKEDKTIDSNNHAVVIYDKEENNTKIGDINGLVYKQGEESWEAVHGPQKMEVAERFKIGESEFIFIPFCSKDGPVTFDYNEYVVAYNKADAETNFNKLEKD